MNEFDALKCERFNFGFGFGFCFYFALTVCAYSNRIYSNMRIYETQKELSFELLEMHVLFSNFFVSRSAHSVQFATAVLADAISNWKENRFRIHYDNSK